VLFHQSFEGLGGACLLNGYDVAVCANCGAGFAGDIPEQSAFDEYYRDLSKYESFDPALAAPPIEQRFYDAAATIEKFIPSPDSRIMEVGSGSGQLLKLLRDRGFWNVLASDPSPGCVAAAERLYGIPGIAGSIFTLPQPEDPFDFLILVGVMEHIRDLAGAVNRLYALLRDGGRVYLETPDASRYAPDADAPFQEFSVEHIGFFSPVSLANLMRRCGFQAIAVERTLRRRNELVCANAFGVFVKSPDPPRPIERDTETEPGLRAYIEGCRAEDARIRARIERSLQPGERMAVWGVGAHTLRLLATGGLDPARIDLFVDSNPKYQGKKLSGIAVESPAALKRYAGPVLISSRGFQREILRAAREQFGLANRFILLYEA
jgi:SAM-dependent methyltransferase